MVVIGIDPGKAVGICVWTGSDNPVHAFQLPALDFEDWLWAYLQAQSMLDIDIHIVMERFDISQRTMNKTKDAHWALDRIGAVKFIARQTDYPVTMQSAGDAKSFGTDYKLKEMSLYQGGEGHADDAVRHVLKYLADQGIYDGPVD